MALFGWGPVGELRRQLEEARARNAVLELQNVNLMQMRDFLQSEVNDARAGERMALQTMANLEVQRRTGVKPYPDAPGYAPNVGDDTPPKSIPASDQGFDVVRKANAAFAEQYRDRYQGSGPIDPEVLKLFLSTP